LAQTAAKLVLEPNFEVDFEDVRKAGRGMDASIGRKKHGDIYDCDIDAEKTWQ